MNFLRYGCVPVGVVEGRAPAEKLERLQQRSAFVVHAMYMSQNESCMHVTHCQCLPQAAVLHQNKVKRLMLRENAVVL